MAAPAPRVVARLATEYGIDLSLRQLSGMPTIACLASGIAGHSGDELSDQGNVTIAHITQGRLVLFVSIGV